MIILASAFGTFVLFLFLGMLALPVTAVLDKSIGKEKGLLLYALLLLLITLFVLPGMSGAVGPDKRIDSAQRDRTVRAEVLRRPLDPFERPPARHDLERNAFLPYSDTRDLPPVTLESPPWIALDFALPPTIPGPAPGHRQVLRGPLPKLTPGDGTGIAEIPDAVFEDYQVKPEDVYDWVLTGGQPYYVYILEIYDGQRWHDEGEPAFEALKWKLVDANAEGYHTLRVRAAYVGVESEAAKYLDRLSVLKRRTLKRTENAADEKERWYLRRTVDNLFVEALRSHGVPLDFRAPPINPDNLRRAAREMAEIGKTGKEGRAGWKHCVELLQVALDEVRETYGPSVRAEYLLELLQAQEALHDEQGMLRTLAEYLRTAPTSAEARTWLGQLHLVGMRLPHEALRYFRSALDRNSRFPDALIGQGDALSYLGDHEGALRSYGRAAGDVEGQLRKGLAQLRLAQLDTARGTAEALLSQDPSLPEALLLRGAALYALGELDSARDAFEALASMPSAPQANGVRARACYDLGLTCLRLGQHDAALKAFEACEKALLLGSSAGPTPDETVSPALGRALVAYAAGDEGALRTHLDTARQQAPACSYLEMFGGMVSSLDGNDASAVRALDAALRAAPGYAELDGWLGKTYLRLGERSVATGDSPKETAATFERAVRFAERAANRESRADRLAYHARLRECLVRLGAQHLPSKQRYSDALAAAEKVLSVSELREQPAALTLSGYCNFQLGRYDECIRRFQAVLDVVPEGGEHPWKTWRDYAAQALADVKHWRSLEEKIVSFESGRFDRQWTIVEPSGVRATIEDGKVHFYGVTRKDGRPDSPSVELSNDELFRRETLERVTLMLRIPRQNRRGEAVNNVTFGVEVRATRGGRSAKAPGIGIYYDKAKLAVRIGSGKEKRYKDGRILRLDPEQMWPGDDEIEVRIEREDAEKGTVAVYLNGELVIRDQLSGFKRAKGNAELRFSGYATTAQEFDVWVSDIRIVKQKD